LIENLQLKAAGEEARREKNASHLQRHYMENRKPHNASKSTRDLKGGVGADRKRVNVERQKEKEIPSLREITDTESTGIRLGPLFSVHRGIA